MEVYALTVVPVSFTRAHRVSPHGYFYLHVHGRGVHHCRLFLDDLFEPVPGVRWAGSDPMVRRAMMALNVDDVMEGLDAQRQQGVEERAAQLLAEEMTLRELREARRLTQVSLARELDIADPE